MTEFKSAASCFPVADVGETLRWYQKHFEFHADPFPSHEPYVFCILRRGEVEIMLQWVEGYQKPDVYSRRAGGVWDLYVRVDDVSALYETVRHALDIVHPLHLQPYGRREFEVKDLNGYILVFSS